MSGASTFTKAEQFAVALAQAREAFDLVGEDCEYFMSRANELKAENIKLRNLVHILCHCMQIHAECDDCRLNGAKGELAFDPLCACDGLHELLREAGIEVS